TCALPILSYQLGYQRGGPRRILIARAKYKVPDTTPTKIVVTERSRQLMKQGLLAPSSIAHILVAKYLFGLPFHRQVAQLAAQEVDHVPLRRAHQGLARAHRRCLRPGSAAASQRQKVLLPILTDCFRWIQACHAQVKDVRSPLTTATGYAIRHEAALLRFLEDGRLKITNNHSERALRTIAVGRKNWLFCGLDDHATSAANLFSLIASCKL